MDLEQLDSSAAPPLRLDDESGVLQLAGLLVVWYSVSAVLFGRDDS